MNAPAQPLPLLVASLKAAKEAMDQHRQYVNTLESQILTHFPTDKTEGSITDKDNGVTVTYKVTRKVDTAKLQDAWMGLTANAQKAFKWSADVDTRQFKAIADLDPQAFAQLAQFVTTTPAKTSVTLKD